VLPQFVLRMKKLHEQQPEGTLDFPIQGTGLESRAFVYIDDFVDGIMAMVDHGKHMNIYNIGHAEELSIADVATLVGDYFGRTITVNPGAAPVGETSRRCPDLTKLNALRYRPRHNLCEGLPLLARWYDENSANNPNEGV